MPMLLIYQLLVVLTIFECTFAGFSKKEAACFARDQFYHEPTDKCYELLHQGPCLDNEWWVLRKPLKSDKDVIVKGVCEKDQCRDSRLFWPGKGCVSVSQKIELCGTDPRSILTNNDFGEGECMCYKSPPHARLDDNPENFCYELNSQGPCNRKEILAIPPDSSVPKCIADPCFHATFMFKKSNHRPIAVAMDNGTCYQLETQGPCPQGQTFKMITETRKPGCYGQFQSCDDVGESCDNGIDVAKVFDSYYRKVGEQKNRKKRQVSNLRKRSSEMKIPLIECDTEVDKMCREEIVDDSIIDSDTVFEDFIKKLKERRNRKKHT